MRIRPNRSNEEDLIGSQDIDIRRTWSERKIAPIRIQPYTEEFIQSVAAFNRRVNPANLPFQVPETTTAAWLPKARDRKIYQEMFLAVVGGFVRGAYTLKHQEFSFAGRMLSVGACQMPVSEGILDKRYGLVGPKIIDDAVRREPLMYGLGIGDRGAAVARLFQAMGWNLRTVPFFFKVRSGFSFLRNIRYLRTTRLRRWLLDASAFSGLAWTGAAVAGALLTRHHGGPSPHTEEVEAFSTWADEIWTACLARYSMVGIRDASTLNILYPPGSKFIRLKICEGRRVAGWAVALDTLMSDDKYFGNMRVGSVVDCLALPEDAHKVAAAAAKVLEQRGVDLLLSNQSHPAWHRGLRMAGFVPGPSNFLFVSSPQLTALLSEIDPDGTGIHLNRGDGDGPIHL